MFLARKTFYPSSFSILEFLFRKSLLDGEFRKMNKRVLLKKYLNKRRHHLKSPKRKRKTKNKDPKHHL
jgi:hypothetical protein